MAEFTRVTSTDETLRRAIQELQDAVTALRRDGRKRADRASDATAEVSALRGELARKLRRPNTLDFNDVFRAAGPAHALGYVPDPGAGDTGGLRFLSDDGTWKPVLDGLFWVLPEEITDPGTRKGGFNGSLAVASALAADSLHARLLQVGNEPFQDAAALGFVWIANGGSYVAVEPDAAIELWAADDIWARANEDIHITANQAGNDLGSVNVSGAATTITGDSADDADVPLTVEGSASAVETFDPLDLSPTAWFKADAGVYSDAGSTPATDGQDVHQWNDQSGNGKHFNTKSTNWPSYETNEQNGLPVIHFVASNSEDMTHSTGDAQAWISPSAATIFTVFRGTGSAGVNPTPWIIYQSAEQARLYQLFADGTLNAYNNDGSADVAAKAGTNNTYQIHTWMHSGGTLYSGTNDTRTASLASTASGNTGGTQSLWTCFLRAAGAYYNQDICEMIFFDYALTETERQLVETYLADKWGITIGYTGVYPGTTDLLVVKDSSGGEVAAVRYDGLYVGGSKMTVP